MRGSIVKVTSLILFSLFWACPGQAQNLEFIKEDIIGIGVNKTVMNNSGELIIAGKSGGNPSVMKMDTFGNVLWHKTFLQEPVRNNSNNQWHFWDLRTDAENNIYLYAEEIYSAPTPPPRVTKLNDKGELIWASADLPPAFEYEPKISTWLHVGDTALTISYMEETVSRVHLTTGAVLGKDSILSSTWINSDPNDMYYNGKQYRESGLGFLAFDKTGEYSIEPNPVNQPHPVRHLDSSGYYLWRYKALGKDQPKSRVRQIQFYDQKGGMVREELIISESTFDCDNLSFTTHSNSGYLFHPKKGILLFGNYYNEINADSAIGGRLFTQVRPTDFQILFDTIIFGSPQWGDAHFVNNDDQIYLQGALSPGGNGAYIMKFNLKDVDEYPASSVTEKQEKTNAIKIYPNPSSTGEFIVQSQKESITKVDVFTMTGQIVYSQKVNALQETLQMDTKGIYLVRVTTDDNKTETLKIVNQ